MTCEKRDPVDLHGELLPSLLSPVDELDRSPTEHQTIASPFTAVLTADVADVEVAPPSTTSPHCPTVTRSRPGGPRTKSFGRTSTRSTLAVGD